jgi:hypothetical protein
VGGEGSSNVRGYLDVLPFAPRQLDRGGEQESCNHYADISAVLVEESHRQLLVPSCIHESGHDPPLPEDQGHSYHQYLDPDLFCALDCNKWEM